jgi:hypothetical protein
VEKEIGETNHLTILDLMTIGMALTTFNHRERPAIEELNEPAFARIFEWIGVHLKACLNENQSGNGNNLWVALANIYLNTSGQAEFVGYLRLWNVKTDRGSFNTKEFSQKVRQWNEGQLEIKNSQVEQEGKKNR